MEKYPVKVWQGRLDADGNNDWRVVVTADDVIVEESDLDAMHDQSWEKVDPTSNPDAVRALQLAAECFAGQILMHGRGGK